MEVRTKGRVVMKERVVLVLRTLGSQPKNEDIRAFLGVMGGWEQTLIFQDATHYEVGGTGQVGHGLGFSYLRFTARRLLHRAGKTKQCKTTSYIITSAWRELGTGFAAGRQG